MTLILLPHKRLGFDRLGFNTRPKGHSSNPCGTMPNTLHRPSRLPLAPWLGCVLLAIPLVVGCHQEVPTVAPPDIATLGRLQPSIRTDLEQATQALKADLRNPGLWGQLGTRYESNGLPEVALVCFEQAAALDSKSPRWPYRAAVVAARAGNLEAAIEWGRASLRLDPSYYTTYERLGTWELQLGNLEQASSYFEQACTLDPQRAGGWAGQARVALQTDEVAQALQSIRKARELDSQDPYWKLLEGITLARLGRDEEAKPLLAEGQGSKPTLIDPWTQSSKSIRSQESDLFQRGMQLEDQNQFDEAIAIYREILADRPGEARLPLRLAKPCSRRNGRQRRWRSPRRRWSAFQRTSNWKSCAGTCSSSLETRKVLGLLRKRRSKNIRNARMVTSSNPRCSPNKGSRSKPSAWPKVLYGCPRAMNGLARCWHRSICANSAMQKPFR